jgi:hypothetical protein
MTEQPIVNYSRVLVTLALLFVAACRNDGESPSARRYLDMFEIDRVFPHTDPRSDLIMTRYRLLERPEVQANLKLSPDQVRGVRNAYTASWAQIPGLSDFVAGQRKKMTGLSEDARKLCILEQSRGIDRITADFFRDKLSELLSRKQQERLDQLVIQVHGPVIIAVDGRIATQLGIGSQQMERIKSLLSKTDRDIVPALQRFGRGFIAGYSVGETAEAREREQTELIARLPKMICQRDSAILDILTDGQQKAFRNLQGQPLQVEWNPWELLRIPFSEESRVEDRH